MRVEEFLTQSAKRLPDKIALTTAERLLTFRELDELSVRLAGVLHSRGVLRGDRVLLYMDNAWETVVAIFAALKAGAIFSIVNPTMKIDKLAFILSDCEPSAVVTLARLAPIAAAALQKSKVSCLVVVTGDGSLEQSPDVVRFNDAISARLSVDLPTPGIDIDLAMLVYTSGSTGFPKGVMMTHQNIVAAATSITTYLENTEDDVILNVLPVSFDYGLYQVLMAIKLGARLVLEKSFAFPKVILDKLARERVTGFPLVPTMASLILQGSDLQPGALPDLRYITNTAAALPPAHIRRLRDLFPGAKLFSMYGLTECKRCTYLPPERLDDRADSVGVPIPNTEAFVVDEAGRELPPEVVGELVIRGPHVMKGYWRNEAATRAALRPGPHSWENVLYTGDLFRRDAEGFLYFVGRKDDIIKTRGEKVSPKEIENVLYALAGVREATVIGKPDPVMGSVIVAVVSLAPQVALTERDIIRHCAQHLEDFMVPKHVEFREALPQTATGKLSRREVAAQEDATP